VLTPVEEVVRDSAIVDWHDKMPAPEPLYVAKGAPILVKLTDLQFARCQRHRAEEVEACERVVSFDDLCKLQRGSDAFTASLFFLRDNDERAAQEVDAAKSRHAPRDDADHENGDPPAESPAKRSRGPPSEEGGVKYATSRAVQVDIMCMPCAAVTPLFYAVQLERVTVMLA